ncbi:hypothetical protein [Oceanobacillus kimchii]
MKMVDVHEDSMKAYVIGQLRQFGFFETEGKSLRELKVKLAILRETRLGK